MAQRTARVIMNGVTGRMGYRQHLVRSILAIRDDGGISLPDGNRITVEPILVGRNADKLATWPLSTVWRTTRPAWTRPCPTSRHGQLLAWAAQAGRCCRPSAPLSHLRLHADDLPRPLALVPGRSGCFMNTASPSTVPRRRRRRIPRERSERSPPAPAGGAIHHPLHHSAAGELGPLLPHPHRRRPAVAPPRPRQRRVPARRLDPPRAAARGGNRPLQPPRRFAPVATSTCESSACPNGRSRSARRRLPNTQRPKFAAQPTTYASDSATASEPKPAVYATCIRHLLADLFAAIDDARPPASGSADAARGRRRHRGRNRSDPERPDVRLTRSDPLSRGDLDGPHVITSPSGAIRHRRRRRLDRRRRVGGTGNRSDRSPGQASAAR